MSYITEIIDQCVEDIWHKYDLDGSNKLDIQETKKFITDILKEIGNLASFEEKQFEDCFKEFQNDDEKIDRKEMGTFILKFSRFQVKQK